MSHCKPFNEVAEIDELKSRVDALEKAMGINNDVEQTPRFRIWSDCNIGRARHEPTPRPDPINLYPPADHPDGFQFGRIAAHGPDGGLYEIVVVDPVVYRNGGWSRTEQRLELHLPFEPYKTLLEQNPAKGWVVNIGGGRFGFVDTAFVQLHPVVTQVGCLHQGYSRLREHLAYKRPPIKPDITVFPTSDALRLNVLERIRVGETASEEVWDLLIEWVRMKVHHVIR